MDFKLWLPHADQIKICIVWNVSDPDFPYLLNSYIPAFIWHLSGKKNTWIWFIVIFILVIIQCYSH